MSLIVSSQDQPEKMAFSIACLLFFRLPFGLFLGLHQVQILQSAQGQDQQRPQPTARRK